MSRRKKGHRRSRNNRRAEFMDDDKRAVDSLAESVRHSISNIEQGIRTYVFQDNDSAYRSVATELRKILVDKDGVASFWKSIKRAKSANSLFELHYGNGSKILLKSFGLVGKGETGDYMDVTPDIYSAREDILYCATHGGRLVSLPEWLKEHLACTRNGEMLKVGTAIKYIAGKEGSHIINPVGDKREDLGIAFASREPTPKEVSELDFNYSNPWRQFVIDAGMRLLAATDASGGRLVEHAINIPERLRIPQTMRMQKKR